MRKLLDYLGMTGGPRPKPIAFVVAFSCVVGTSVVLRMLGAPDLLSIFLGGAVFGAVLAIFSGRQNNSGHP
jgi:hypothetical protein